MGRGRRRVRHLAGRAAGQSSIPVSPTAPAAPGDRTVGWDALLLDVIRGRLVWHAERHVVMEANRTGYDDGLPYTAALVGGWEIFNQASATITWKQARASFSSMSGQPFQPLRRLHRLHHRGSAAAAGWCGSGVPDVWDQGLWGQGEMGSTADAVCSCRAQHWLGVDRRDGIFACQSVR